MSKPVTSDQRLAKALHDLDAVMHHGRCSFARTWSATRYGERFEDNEFGCIGYTRRTKSGRKHVDEWEKKVPFVRSVVKELL